MVEIPESLLEMADKVDVDSTEIDVRSRVVEAELESVESELVKIGSPVERTDEVDVSTATDDSVMTETAFVGILDIKDAALEVCELEDPDVETKLEVRVDVVVAGAVYIRQVQAELTLEGEF